MAHYTREQRQEIVKDFAIRNGGRFEPASFVDEVKAVGHKHPAHEWFTWDKNEAAYRFWLEQARDFAQGLKIVFSIEYKSRGPVSVRTVEVPLVISPIDGRADGGGYILYNHDNRDHRVELCRQAAQDLGSWFRRYRSALDFAGANVASVEKLIGQLEAAAAPATEAAE